MQRLTGFCLWLQGAEDKLNMIRAYRSQVEKELRDICSDILGVLDKHLIPSSQTGESKVFYYKMKVINSICLLNSLTNRIKRAKLLDFWHRVLAHHLVSFLNFLLYEHKNYNKIHQNRLFYWICLRIWYIPIELLCLVVTLVVILSTLSLRRQLRLSVVIIKCFHKVVENIYFAYYFHGLSTRR